MGTPMRSFSDRSAGGTLGLGTEPSPVLGLDRSAETGGEGHGAQERDRRKASPFVPPHTPRGGDPAAARAETRLQDHNAGEVTLSPRLQLCQVNLNPAVGFALFPLSTVPVTPGHRRPVCCRKGTSPPSPTREPRHRDVGFACATALTPQLQTSTRHSRRMKSATSLRGPDRGRPLERPGGSRELNWRADAGGRRGRSRHRPPRKGPRSRRSCPCRCRTRTCPRRPPASVRGVRSPGHSGPGAAAHVLRSRNRW